MLRVYVAGAYSASNVIDVLNNMRRGMRISTEVLLAGFAPFAPWLDYHYQLQLRDGEELSVNDYYAYSMAWLEASDIVYVIPGWENSKGTLAEIERAHAFKIPVVFSMNDLKSVGENLKVQKMIDANHSNFEATQQMPESLDVNDKDKKFMMQL